MADYIEQLGSNCEYTLRLAPHLREFLLFALDRWVEGGKNIGEAVCIRTALMKDGNEPLFDALKRQIAALEAELAAVRAERDELAGWKREAIEVLTKWSKVAAVLLPKDLPPKYLGRSEADVALEVVAAAQADSRRLDWLEKLAEYVKNNPQTCFVMLCDDGQVSLDQEHYGYTARASIDAAMNAEKQS